MADIGASAAAAAAAVSADAHVGQDSVIEIEDESHDSTQARATEDAGSDNPASEPHEDVPLTLEEEEEVRAWQLRFPFQDYFMRKEIYGGFKDAGWRHHQSTGTYHAPSTNGEVPIAPLHANELFEYLDRFRTPNITNTLQLPPKNPLSQMSPEEERQGRLQRNEIIRKVYRRMNPPTKSNGDKAKETVQTTEKEGEDRSKGPVVKLPPRRKSARFVPRSDAATTRSANQSETATVHEKGADNFLRRSRGTKIVSSQEIAFVHFPSAEECVSQFREYPTKRITEIEDAYKRSFDDWMFLLTTQNSLLLYGLGSKRHLLDAFARDKLETEGDVLTIDGYDREVRIDAVLDVIVNHFLDGAEPDDRNEGYLNESMVATHDIVRRATAISQSLAEKQRNQRRPLYFVLHNIDGTGLRSREVQEALAALVAHSTIERGVNAVRLVASVDHVNASALLWDNRTSANFSWVWKEVHTYRPYIEELAVGGGEDRRKSSKSQKLHEEEMDDSTLLNVLTSLSPRHAEVVKMLATLQLEDQKPVNHAALYHNCKHKMTVGNDTQLRQYLVELIDHGIVESGKDSGGEWLRIPHSREKLHEIINFEVQK